MKSIIGEIQASFQNFIDDKSANVLLVCCEPEHSPLLLKSIDAIEQNPENDDIFLTFGHKFTSSDIYVSELLVAVRQQVAQVNEELTKRGDSQLSPPPPELDDESQPPGARLAKALQYVRSIVPPTRRVIWIIYPLEVNEPAQYLDVVDLIYTQLGEPSLQTTKLIVRDSEISPVLTPSLEDQARVTVYRPQLDPASLENKLTEKANDPRVPADEQAQMHMMLAGMDVANRRFDRALARNQELLGYFSHTGQKHHQSIVLNNIGDLHYLQRRFAEAQSFYQRAVSLSVKLESKPLVLYQSMNLGNALFTQRKFTDALTYYTVAEQLAQASSAPIQQVQALGQTGVTNYELGKLNEAGEAWEKAVELSRKLQYEEGLRTNLERLQKLYDELGNSPRFEACDAELASLSS